MRTTFVLFAITLAAILFSSCGGNSAPSFDTPEDTALTFFKAASSKDKDLMAQCFSKSRDEFKMIWDKSLSEKDLDEVSKQFGDGSVVKSESNGEKASVKVKLPGHPRGEEQFEMIKEGNNWVILDF